MSLLPAASIWLRLLGANSVMTSIRNDLMYNLYTSSFLARHALLTLQNIRQRV